MGRAGIAFSAGLTGFVVLALVSVPLGPQAGLLTSTCPCPTPSTVDFVLTWASQTSSEFFYNFTVMASMPLLNGSGLHFELRNLASAPGIISSSGALVVVPGTVVEYLDPAGCQFGVFDLPNGTWMKSAGLECSGVSRLEHVAVGYQFSLISPTPLHGRGLGLSCGYGTANISGGFLLSGGLRI